MLETCIDEISFVLISDYNQNLEDYICFCDNFISQITSKLCLRECFGDDKRSRGFSGYDMVNSFDNWKCIIGYNHLNPHMGIYIKFTGQGLKKLLQFRSYQVYDLTKEIQGLIKLDKNKWDYRVSKIDLAVDFINEDVLVNEIANRLRSHSLIRSEKGRRNVSKIRMISENDNVETIYIGNHRKKGGAEAYLRIYDKKKEQEQTKGIFYKKALSLKNWTRFEASFGKQYAHQIGSDLLNISTEKELSSLIFRRISDRYRFFSIENGSEIMWLETKIMLQLANSHLDVMNSTKSEVSDLIVSYKYLINQSGLISFMYKLADVYGEDVIKKFFERLEKELKSYKPNSDVLSFLKKEKERLKTQTYPWIFSKE